MAQHFLLSAKARTISEAEAARMSEDEAREVFEGFEWVTLLHKTADQK